MCPLFLFALVRPRKCECHTYFQLPAQIGLSYAMLLIRWVDSDHDRTYNLSFTRRVPYIPRELTGHKH